MIVWIQQNPSLLLAAIGCVLAIDKWIKGREIKDIKIQHEFQLQENKRLLIASKYDSDYQLMYQTTLRVEKEMISMRENASTRHGNIQGMIGTLELRMNTIVTKHEAEIKELFRLSGRRETDHLNSN